MARGGVSRRYWCYLRGLAVATAIALGGCGRQGSAPQVAGGPPAAREDVARQVVVYTSVDQTHAEPVLKEFERSSGLRVLPVYDVEATKTAGLAHRLRAERERPQADVFWSGEFTYTLELAQQGLLAPYSSPAAADLPEQYRDPGGLWTGMPGRARVLLVNTNLVRPAELPRSLQDLTSERWPGDQVGIAQPLFGTTLTHAAALYAAWGPQRARSYFVALRERGVRVVDGNSVVRDLVAAGQLAVGLTDTDDAAGAVSRGAPVRAVAPDQEGEGTLVIPGTVALVAGGPHPTEGRALVDYLVGPQVEQALLAGGWSQIPLREGVAAPDPLGLGQIRGMRLDLRQVAEQLPRAREELREIFIR